MLIPEKTACRDLKGSMVPEDAAIGQLLHKANIFLVNLVGGPGCGKTSLIEATAKRLMPDVHVGVVKCDIVSHRDTHRLLRFTDQVVEAVIDPAGHLSAEQMRAALHKLDLNWLDLLFVEHMGSQAVQRQLELETSATVSMFSVTGGEDKPEKYPKLVAGADLILLNKIDLCGLTPFDMSAFKKAVERENPAADLLEISTVRGYGLEKWTEWLKKRLRKNRDCSMHWFG